MIVYWLCGLEKGMDRFGAAKFEAIFFRAFEIWLDRDVWVGASQKSIHVLTIGFLLRTSGKRTESDVFPIALQTLAKENVASIFLPLLIMLLF